MNLQASRLRCMKKRRDAALAVWQVTDPVVARALADLPPLAGKAAALAALRAREHRQALEAADPDLARRRAEAAAQGALRRAGWRPGTDGDWAGPDGRRATFAQARATVGRCSS